MADHQAKVYNEKLRGIALMGRNGAVLVAASAFARWYNEQFDVTVAIWLAAALLLAYTGTALLSLMQQED